MHSLFYFDTEDSISPPQAGNDDIVLWIADVLTKHNVTGSFHIIGDKARLLEKRGRRDVIEAVKRHDVSSHYNHGSVHPTTTEQVAEADWDEGVRIALQNERVGFDDIERIFGRCSGLTRHGGSYAPQTVHAAGLCGKVFYGVPFQLPRHRAFWFAGNLCFSILGLIIEDNGNGRGYLEGDYHNDETFNQKLTTLLPLLDETIKRESFTALFGSHPLRMNTTEFACFNYYGGVNRPDIQPPPQRPDHEKVTIRRNFERFVATLSQVKNLDILSLGELAKVYGSSPGHITQAELSAYAQRVCDCDDVPLDERFSPAELLVAMAQYVSEKPQPTYPVVKVIGPTHAVDDAPLRNVTAAQLRTLAGDLIGYVRQTGKLPHTINCAALLDVLSQAILDDSDGVWSSGVRSTYPQVADHWRPQVQSMGTWAVFGPDLDLSQIITLTCLQAWSAKPATADSSSSHDLPMRGAR